jgi:hypothetical protein
VDIDAYSYKVEERDYAEGDHISVRGRGIFFKFGSKISYG